MSRLTPVLIAFTYLGSSLFAVADEARAAEAKKTITLIVSFDESQARPEVVAALKSELAEIWRGEPVKLDWRPIESIQKGDSFTDLVVVHFKGDCQVHPPHPFFIDERGPQGAGPLAFSPVVNGMVQPFSSVLCDRIDRTVAAALRPNQQKSANSLYGRALGRVVAHELYHILNQTRGHQKSGLAQKSLTGQQLIAPEFHFVEAAHP